MQPDILKYPYPLNLRWNHVHWFPVFFRRHLSSDFGVMADLAVQGASFNLMALAMDMQPPGTLPIDPEVYARLLRLDRKEWDRLMLRDVNPLHGWVRIQCGEDLRLTHPLLLEGLEVAVRAGKLRQRGTSDRKRGDPPDAGRAPR